MTHILKDVLSETHMLDPPGHLANPARGDSKANLKLTSGCFEHGLRRSHDCGTDTFVEMMRSYLKFKRVLTPDGNFQLAREPFKESIVQLIGDVRTETRSDEILDGEKKERQTKWLNSLQEDEVMDLIFEDA